MYLSQILLSITLLIFVCVEKRGLHSLPPIAPLPILVTFLMFSIAQYQNMLWGFQIAWYVIILSASLSLYSLSNIDDSGRRDLQRICLAAVCAVIASFSSVQGLFIWIVGLAILTLKTSVYQNKSKRLTFYTVLWLICGMVVWLMYFWTYTEPSGTPDTLYFMKHPIRCLAFTIEMFGNIALNEFFAVSSGIVVVGVAIYVFVTLFKARVSEIEGNCFWVAFACFNLLTIASIAVGRSGGKMSDGLESRYVTFTILFIISLLMLLNRLKGVNVLTTKVYSHFMLFIIFISATSTFKVIYQCEKERPASNRRTELFLNYETQADSTLASEFSFPGADRVRCQAAALKTWNYSIFRTTE
jgi:hypothetical protein